MIKNEKSNIEKSFGIPQCQQILKFNGENLENNKILVYYGIEPDDIIVLAIRPENLNEISKLKRN